MGPLNFTEDTMILKDRFRHITCVIVQIYKLEGNSWRELTKDFVLLHMYYDEEDKEAKLIAIDGIKLIVRGFVITSNLQLVRPTKKFVHFISSKQGRSEMYGFGFHQIPEVEKFLRLFRSVQRGLQLSSRTAIQSRFGWSKRRLSISSTKSQPSCPTFLSTATPEKDKNMDAVSFIPEKDLSWREQMSQENIDASMQHVEKGVQELSFTSDASVTTPNSISTPSLSAQTCVIEKNNSLHSNPSTFGKRIDSSTFDFNLDNTLSIEQKQYELWSLPPWNALLDRKVYNNQENVTSAWDSLLKH